MAAEMFEQERVSVIVNEKTFELSTEVLETRSLYIRHLISKGKPLDLSAFSENACEVLLAYLQGNEICFADQSLSSMITVLETAEQLGIESYENDLEEALIKRWFELSSLDTVLGVANALGVRGQLVNSMIDNVLDCFLQDEKCSMKDSNVSYDVLIFLTRLTAFWDGLNSKCAYFFTYEAFYANVLSWMFRTTSEESNVHVLAGALKLHTLPESFFAEVFTTDASSVSDIRNMVEADVKMIIENVYKSIRVRAVNLESVFFVKQGNGVVVKRLNDDGNGWNDMLSIDNIFTPVACVRSTEDLMYVLGKKSMREISSQIDQHASENDTAFPEEVAIRKVILHGGKLFVFVDSHNDLALYVYIHELNKFIYVDKCPVQNHVAVTSHGKHLYVVGEQTNDYEESKDIIVSRFDVQANSFTTIGIIKKSWREVAERKNVVYYTKNEVVVTNNELHVLTFERQSNIKCQVHLHKMNLSLENVEEFEELKVEIPHSIDKHSSLISIGASNNELHLIFSSNYGGALSLAVLNLEHRTMDHIGYLPDINDKNLKLYNVYLIPNPQGPEVDPESVLQYSSVSNDLERVNSVYTSIPLEFSNDGEDTSDHNIQDGQKPPHDDFSVLTVDGVLEFMPNSEENESTILREDIVSITENLASTGETHDNENAFTPTEDVYENAKTDSLSSKDEHGNFISDQDRSVSTSLSIGESRKGDLESTKSFVSDLPPSDPNNLQMNDYGLEVPLAFLPVLNESLQSENQHISSRFVETHIKGTNNVTQSPIRATSTDPITIVPDSSSEVPNEASPNEQSITRGLSNPLSQSQIEPELQSFQEKVIKYERLSTSVETLQKSSTFDQSIHLEESLNQISIEDSKMNDQRQAKVTVEGQDEVHYDYGKSHESNTTVASIHKVSAINDQSGLNEKEPSSVQGEDELATSKRPEVHYENQPPVNPLSDQTQRRNDGGVWRGPRKEVRENNPDGSENAEDCVYDEPGRYFTSDTIRAHHPLRAVQSPEHEVATPLEPRTVASLADVGTETAVVYSQSYAQDPVSHSTPKAAPRKTSKSSSRRGSEGGSYDQSLDVVDYSPKELSNARRSRKAGMEKRDKKTRALDLLTSFF